MVQLLLKLHGLINSEMKKKYSELSAVEIAKKNTLIKLKVNLKN